MEDNRAYYFDDELMHYARGQRAKHHKYKAIVNGRYVYDDASGMVNGVMDKFRSVEEKRINGINKWQSAKEKAAQKFNESMAAANEEQRRREEAKQAHEQARRDRQQKALEEATRRAKARKAAQQKRQEQVVSGVTDTFRKMETARKVRRDFYNDWGHEISDAYKKTKQTVLSVPGKAKQQAKFEKDFWSGNTSGHSPQKVSASSYIAEQEKRARQQAAKHNSSAQRDSAMKEKSASAHNRATSSRQTKKRSAAKNKQRIANAKASRAR